MAARRPVLAAVVLALCALVALRCAFSQVEQEAFVNAAPAVRSLRATTASEVVPLIARAALPEPIPDDAILPVDFSRTSLYWGLLFVLVMMVLFSSYFFN
mmetsp:Transcript_28637/g.92053  ORF Transcript_28637/g.92053 Transcript_28637/m.92053 type:complete len:100 (-) Transcript_28637:10-309(-)|eukprot:CAMPEP_0203965144 /NCGR_PEP_ID=MMETSP0359-20131031/94714_1 /ASSEMBLY_ACC=CAM_ASM_000338 /TAXON_ID=268821 /ORGANISM="Scrippsiella Hangoei, Strain SHTV-5" /LENGTH=99 /DNA_ID=CAMNT_0050901903 /DNA_START=84 /DNA_END=383 /DNA_ORIENTATION=-